jgi:hypothetical protein
MVTKASETDGFTKITKRGNLTPKLSAADRSALSRAIALAKEVDEPGRKQQIEYMLEESGWQKTGEFASYGCQMRSLQLRPWEFPPVWIHAGDTNPEHAAGAALLQRLISNNLSRFEPDPIGALAKIEARTKNRVRKILT